MASRRPISMAEIADENNSSDEGEDQREIGPAETVHE